MFAPQNVLRDLRWIGTAEGISFLVLLLIAMPLKYLADMPMAVKVVGMLHGVLFILFVVAAFRAMLLRQWSIGRFLFALLMSVIPAGTFYLDVVLKREEREAGLSA